MMLLSSSPAGVRPHAFGWSLGGGVLLSLACTWPESVRSVAVFGFTSNFLGGFTPLMRLITALLGRRWYVAAMGALGHGLLLNKVLEGRPTTDSEFSAAELRAARAAIQRGNAPEGISRTMQACHSFFIPRTAEGLGRIAMPALTMHTEGDGSVHGRAKKVADTAAIRLGTMRTYGDDRRAPPEGSSEIAAACMLVVLTVVTARSDEG